MFNVNNCKNQIFYFIINLDLIAFLSKVLWKYLKNCYLNDIKTRWLTDLFYHLEKHKWVIGIICWIE